MSSMAFRQPESTSLVTSVMLPVTQAACYNYVIVDTIAGRTRLRNVDVSSTSPSTFMRVKMSEESIASWWKVSNSCSAGYRTRAPIFSAHFLSLLAMIVSDSIGVCTVSVLQRPINGTIFWHSVTSMFS